VKTKQIECFTPEAVREHLKTMVRNLNTPAKSGNGVGGVSRLAEKTGDMKSSISAAIRGVQAPSKKVLSFLGLEKADVYVKTEVKKPM